MNNFEGFGLSDALKASLTKMNYTEPTPIQVQAIPLALKGHDILGSAQTGTGKTAAFSIPLIEALLRSPRGTALVLTPTRELAKQVLDVIHQLLGHKSTINTAFIIGGEAYGKQMQQLRANPRIIVGTPGRINDHLQRGSLKLHDTGFLVLDETDRMLDMGFGVQLDKIVEYLPAKRQTLMFSATLPHGIIAISDKYLNSPKRVSTGETNVVATNIKQEVIRIEQSDKYQELQIQLNERQGSVIVFVKTKYNADKMAKKLRQDGFTSEGLHGDLRQNKRDKVMQNFRSMNFRVLVATDIAARGLDVPHIEHVINYDLPQVAEDYIHRMGRTARAGAQGSAISFISNQDGRKWHAIERLLNPEAANDHKDRPQGKNKARKKPYRGRPQNDQKSFNAKSSNAKAFQAEQSSEGDQGRSQKSYKKPYKDNNQNVEKPSGERQDRNAQQRTEKPANPYIKDRKKDKKPNNAKSANGKKYAGKKSGGFKSGKPNTNGASPMKRRSKNKSAPRKAA